MYIHTYLYIMFIHEIWIRYGRSKMDVTFKVNQLFKGEEEEEEKSSWRARSRARLMPVFTRSSFRTSVGLFVCVCACERVCMRVRVCVLVRFLNVTRKKVEKAIQKDAVALNHKLVHLPEEFFFIFFCVECRFVIF